MSDSIRSRATRDGESPRVPRAIIHKKILDTAAEHPEASMEALADRVSGASVELVDQVLDDYGDPADDQKTHSTSEPTQGKDRGDSTVAMIDQNFESASDPGVDPSELTEKQRETLRAIAENPHATQTELAEEFDVSAATISNRVNSIPGFEWEDRHRIVDTMFDTDPQSTDRGEPDNGSWEELVERITHLEGRLEDFERRLDGDDGCKPIFSDSELVHKMIHACMESEQITEEEELELLKAFLNG